MCLTGAEYCERSSVPVKQRRVLRNFFYLNFVFTSFFFFFYIFQSPGERVFEVFQKRERNQKWKTADDSVNGVFCSKLFVLCLIAIKL